MNDLLEELNDLYFKAEKTLGGNSYAEDVVDIASRAFAPVDVIVGFVKLGDHYKYRKIRRYLEEDLNVEKSMNELFEYISIPRRAYFVSVEIKKVLLSNSVLASALSLYIVFKISSENRDVKHEELLLLKMLGEMTDYDIYNLDYMINNIKSNIDDCNFFDINKLPEEKRYSYILTLKLCANSGFVTISENNFYNVDLNEDEQLPLGEIYKIEPLFEILQKYLYDFSRQHHLDRE